MIKVEIFRNHANEIDGFTVKNHGKSIVCAAVSILVINTINCIENFTTEKIELTMNENGGFIKCVFPRIRLGEHNHDVDLLTKTMAFGLQNIQLEHKNDICITNTCTTNKEVSS